MASAAYATARINGTTTPSPAEDEELYNQLLRLRDVIIAGQHTSFRLSASAIASLKASLKVPDAQTAGIVQPQLNGATDSTTFATDQAQLQQSSSFPTFTGLPGLQASSAPFPNGSAHSFGAKPASAAGLDPIFLEKSDSLVRAEGQLKRQRLERDLQAQVDQRKHASRDKDAGADAPSPIDIDIILLRAQERVKPTPGLRVTDKPGSAASSSFDENDYYSSQVQSDWSTEASSSKGSDKAAGAFTADFERLDGALQASSSHAKRATHIREPAVAGHPFSQASKSGPYAQAPEPDDIYNPEDEDEDDEYTPPDATAFDSYRAYGAPKDIQDVTPPDDDNSEYEPGEITQDSNIPTPSHQAQQPVQPSPRVPVIRNHLTHIAAPQPNRVSPLATAKGPSIELELVNGRPELVQKPQQRSTYVQSRPSSASPSANGVSGSGKKRRNKKRKREHEPTGRSKRRRERQNAMESPASPVNQEPFIKDEPVSPPPFTNVPEVPQYARQYAPHRPANIDLVTPRHVPHIQYVTEPPRSGLRYEYAQPTSPAFVRVASPSAHRPVQRDTQDLRRVASLHYAQRPSSPARAYSPVGPYMNDSMTYGDQRTMQPAPIPDDHVVPKHNDQASDGLTHYVRADRSRSPPKLREYRDMYTERIASPALMPPPAAFPRRQVIVDQFGNRYVAAEPAPTAASVHTPRVSVPPVEAYRQSEMAFERAPSRTSVGYTQQLPSAVQYEPDESHTAPPSSRRQAAPEQQIEYVDANGYRLREYNPRPPESSRYVEAPTSPVYQQIQRYEQMPPPPQPAREPTSPIYVPRSYGVQPDEHIQAPSNYIRHASVAPVQYVRKEAPRPPARAVSVMPGIDYAASTQPQRGYSQAFTQAPQSIRYVDAQGNEVFPREVRQVSEFKYQ